jgi:hypothetical protein
MIEKIRLVDLAFACYVYNFVGGIDDGGYTKFRKLTHSKPNLADGQHRKWLLEWLNDWGCRQFKIADHDSASNEVRDWYSEFGRTLPSEGKGILSLTEADLEATEKAYNGLVNRTASQRKMNNGASTPVHFGPVGTAKILFALRPDAFIPWDNYMIRSLELDGYNGCSYSQFLRKVTKWLTGLAEDCKREEFELDELPDRVRRTTSSLAKLIDEYLWVTVTYRFETPPKATLEDWFRWS